MPSTPPPFDQPVNLDPEALKFALTSIGDDEFWIKQGVEYSSHAASLFTYGALVGIAARLRANPAGVMAAATMLNPLPPSSESPEETVERRRLITVRALGATLSEEELQTLAQQAGNPISDHLKRQAALPALEPEEPPATSIHTPVSESIDDLTVSIELSGGVDVKDEEGKSSECEPEEAPGGDHESKDFADSDPT